MSKRQFCEEDVVDTSAVDVNLLLGLKSKPLSQSKVSEIKGIFNKAKKHRKEQKHLPKNPHVTVNNIYQAVSMYENVTAIVDDVSSSLEDKMKGSLRKEQRDLKRISSVMSVMANNSRDALSKLSDEASRTAFQRLKKIEEEDDDMEDKKKHIEVARQKCNQYISNNSTMAAEKTKLKRKAKTKSSKNNLRSHSGFITEDSEYIIFNLNNGSIVKFPKPANGQIYMPREIWPLIADKVMKKDVRSVLILLVDSKKIPCQLRNAYSRLKDYLDGKEIK